MRSKHQLYRSLRVVLAAAMLGAIYNYFKHSTPAVGAAGGALIGGTLVTLERTLLRREVGGPLDPLPFLPYLALRSAIYAFVVLVVNELMIRFASPVGRFVSLDRLDIEFSFVLCIAFNLLFGVNELLGPGVLFSFAAGRYRHPRREERVLLFVDMRSSTAIAERLGEERFLGFLNRFIFDVTIAVAEAGGEIHKYVGDEVISTWPLAPGANEAACVRACFAALERLRVGGPDYEREFGERADFRAGMHCGSVVVGELGHLKKEIALIGDTMNTAARIQHACREMGFRVLASATLLDRLSALPQGVTAHPLGPLTMRGKQAPLELYALEASAAAAEATRSAEARLSMRRGRPD
jgi:adenylate cyclase